MSKGRDLKPHIGIFGRRNNGKSSFINVITGQDVAIVSDVAGTTTDPVKKSIEIFGIGPAILIDTAGIDDTGELGKKRIEKTLDVIKTIDCAVLIITNNVFDSFEMDIIRLFKNFDIPYIIVHNKSDIEEIKIPTLEKIKAFTKAEVFEFNTHDAFNKEFVIDALKRAIPETVYQKPSLFEGLVKPKDIVLLITPIDSEAPDGRMILPQVMAWRDVLDNDCICMSVKETELPDFMKLGIKPALVVTDSQAFEEVSKIIPSDIPLTGFSIVYARMRGDFESYKKGTPKISELRDGDRVLILESCTHQVSCDDIGRFKIPNWIKRFTNKNIEFDIVSGLNKPERDLMDYALVIQCGGCVVTRKQLINRLKPAIDAGVPVTNYGMAIAYMTGIYNRAMEPFNRILSEVEM